MKIVTQERKSHDRGTAIAAAFRAMTRIVLSYRRADSADITGRIRDKLKMSYGPRVFIDVEDIPPGSDYRKYLREQIQKCDVVLAIVGPNWRGHTENGQARLNEPDDPVRIEIEAALKAGRRIVPVRVGGAAMPDRKGVPKSIQDFCFCQGSLVGSGADFHPQMDQLIERLDQAIKGDRSRRRWEAGLPMLTTKRAAAMALGMGGVLLAGAIAPIVFLPPEPQPPSVEQASAFVLVRAPPPDDFSSEDVQSFQSNVFKQLWVKFANVLPRGQLGILPPDDRELEAAPCEYANRFAKLIPAKALLNSLFEYEKCMQRRISYLVEPKIILQDTRAVIRAVAESIDRNNIKFVTIGSADKLLAVNQPHAPVMAAIVSYRLARDLLSYHSQKARQSLSFDGVPPARKASVVEDFWRYWREVEDSVVEQFRRQWHVVRVDLRETHLDALPDINDCQDFSCIDHFTDVLAGRIAWVEEDAETAHLGPTALEEIRLTMGRAMQ